MSGITAAEARVRIKDMVALANSGGIYDGNRSVIYMAHLAALLYRPDAPARTDPTEEQVRDAIHIAVEDVVEAAARAIYDLGRCDGVSFEDAKLADFGHATALYRMDAASSEQDARAALAVIVPAVTEQVRALHKRVHLVFTWNSGLHAEDPCPECDGKAGEWPCGCWGDYDIEYHCLECSSLTEKHRVAWPCPTVRLLDELDAAARGEQP